MHGSKYLIATLCLCVLIFAAGCTQSTGTQVPVTTATPSHEISALSLLSSDVPEGFALKDARTKQPGELRGLAADLGWEGGYVTHFTKSSDNPVNSSEISQSIARYPAENISTILSYALIGDKADKDYSYTVLASPALGDHSEAFQANARAQMIVKPDESNPLVSGNAKAELKQDFIEIAFSKGNTFEVFRWTGPDANYTLLKGMAETAYKKIP